MALRCSTLLTLSFLSYVSAQVFPDCVTGPLANTTVCNVKASPLQRATALADLMTMDEKIAVSGAFASGLNVSRLGLPEYVWWNEALHGIANSPGVVFEPNDAQWGYATSFPQPILTAAAFDDNLVYQVGEVISIEGRAYNNRANGSDYSSYGANTGFHAAGLEYWTPNVNPFRDPRWGRGQETPGEDPFRTSQYVRHFIPAMQGGNNPKYLRVGATCKHFAGYDLENWENFARYGFDAVISTQDLAEYYLPPFQACTRDASVSGVMCSYNSVNGVPSCANSYLLQTLLEFWGWRDDAFHWVTSDCGAIGYLTDYHLYAANYTRATAQALNAGVDYECGFWYPGYLGQAYAEGLYNETALDAATIHRYALLTKLGYFDPANDVPWRTYDWSTVNTLQAQQLAYTAAAKGIVLLKNDGTLPLNVPKRGLKVALVGCWANATTQLQGNYAGPAPFLISPLQALQSVNGVTVTIAPGIVGLCDSLETDMAAVTSAAADADAIIYIGGLDNSIEAEGMDREQISWTAPQQSIISTLATYKKPMVVVAMGGGQLDSTFIKKNKNIGSLVWAGYPGQSGGQAIVDVLLGKVNPAGRLVTTQYPAEYTNLPMYDMSLRPGNDTPGRTYSWYSNAVYPFGYGLHYTTFKASASIAGPNIKVPFNTANLVQACRNSGNAKFLDLCPFRDITVQVTNTGGKNSDYSALAFVSGQFGPSPYPIKRLVGYSRISNIKIGTFKTTTIPVTLGSLARVDAQGRRVLYPGNYKLTIDTNPSLASLSFSITGPEIVLEDLPQPPPQNEPLGDYSQLGCYADNAVGQPRILPNLIYNNSSNAPITCATACSAASYKYSGTENGSERYCGNSLPSSAALVELLLCLTVCPTVP